MAAINQGRRRERQASAFTAFSQAKDNFCWAEALIALAQCADNLDAEAEQFNMVLKLSQICLRKNILQHYYGPFPLMCKETYNRLLER